MSKRYKVPYEIILKSLEDIESGRTYVSEIARELGVDERSVRTWRKQYRTMGASSFEPRERNKAYTKEQKLDAIEAYRRGEGTLEEVSYRRGISSSTQLYNWIKKYNGHEEIRDYDPKGDVYMTKGRATTIEERIEIVNWCKAHDQSYKLTAERYQVSYGQVYAWVAKYRTKGEAGLTDERGHRKPEETLTAEEKQAREMKRLQAEIEWLKMENEVLKKVKEVERKLYSERFGKKRNT